MDDLDYGETVTGLKSGAVVFGRFTLEKLIGRGGMAQVWRATDGTLGTRVALKFLRQLVITDRALRGDGWWGNFGPFCRSADRGVGVPGYFDHELGFRLALTPSR